MAFTLTPSIISVISLLLLSLASSSLSTPSGPLDQQLLTVSNSVFSDAIKAAVTQIHQTLSILSTVTGLLGDLRLSTAVSDCADLLDASSEELTWSLDLTGPSRTPVASSTGNPAADLGSWLSAALGNQDTCLDGFEGTDGTVKALVGGGVDGVASLISQVLGMVRKVPSGMPAGVGWFPGWMKGGDRRLLQMPVGSVAPNVTVASDGSGNFTSVMDAVFSAPDYSMGRYVIYVRRGVYNENVEIKKRKWHLTMIGDGIGATVISGNRSFIDGWTTFRSATFAVSGRGFIARDITFRNTAGPQKHQAVALRSDSDLSAFYRCGIDGYQDALYAHSLRQFYSECRITGTVDFIFGNAAAVLQNCEILARKPLVDQKNSITAHGRKDPNQNTGFCLQYCNISADAELLSAPNSTATYLGRPWKEYSRTIVMQSYLSSAIRPEGWLEWQGDFALGTLFYAEYMNYGPGSGLGNRVKWPGFHVLNTSSQAYNYSVAQFIQGNQWLPETGVRYKAGLTG